MDLETYKVVMDYLQQINESGGGTHSLRITPITRLSPLFAIYEDEDKLCEFATLNEIAVWLKVYTSWDETINVKG